MRNVWMLTFYENGEIIPIFQKSIDTFRRGIIFPVNWPGNLLGRVVQSWVKITQR